MIRKIWSNTFDEEGMELLESTEEDVEQIIDLFIADKIDPQIFLSNLKVLLQIDAPYFKEADKSVKPASYSILNPPTRGGISFWSFINQPRAIPLWFLAAYPDIMVWWDEQQETHHRNPAAPTPAPTIDEVVASITTAPEITDADIADTFDQITGTAEFDDGATEFIKMKNRLSGLLGIKEDTEDCRNNKGKARPKYLKNLIQSYKATTGKELEVIAKNWEDDLYAGAEFFEMFGSESNFTFVAENTAKFYLELSKNHSTSTL